MSHEPSSAAQPDGVTPSDSTEQEAPRPTFQTILEALSKSSTLKMYCISTTSFTDNGELITDKKIVLIPSQPLPDHNLDLFIAQTSEFMAQFDQEYFYVSRGYQVAENEDFFLPRGWFSEGYTRDASVHMIFYPDEQFAQRYNDYLHSDLRTTTRRLRYLDQQKRTRLDYLGVGIARSALRLWKSGEDIGSFY